jgi:hypothetical protein
MASTIQPYVEYANFSELIRQTCQAYQKRPWVPAWLWGLVSQPHVCPEMLSKDLEAAGKKAVEDLFREQAVLSHGMFDPFGFYR